MLIEFTVGNYRSFKEQATISLVATRAVAGKSNQSIDENNVFSATRGLRLLKTAAIFGANGSGKSNYIKALEIMRRFVLRSSREGQIDDPIPVEPFALDDVMPRQSTHFEVVFIRHGKQYRYGFKATQQRVTAEWLYWVPTSREVRLFERDGDDIQLSVAYKEGKELGAFTRPNALFLSVGAQFNNAIATEVLRWFRDLSIISGLEDKSRHDTERLMDSPSGKTRIIQLLKTLDLGFEDITIEQVKRSLTLEQPIRIADEEFTYQHGDKRRDDGKVIASARSYKTMHRKPGSHEMAAFDMDQHESEGTRKLFALAGSLLASLDQGDTVVIDELDGRLHSILTRQIVELFNSQDTNPNNAQLIFATHDTNLLTNRLFRRDQIWFAEKDHDQATRLYSLVEYRIRNDASFEKDYMSGRYGAIPFIGEVRGFTPEMRQDNATKRGSENA